MKDIQFPDSSFIGAGTSSVLWVVTLQLILIVTYPLQKFNVFFFSNKNKKNLVFKTLRMELPKMPNESKTRNQIQKKSQITITVFLQLKNKVDLQIPVIYLTF